MKFKESKSIYLQIADRICDEILQGQYTEEERIPSVREYAATVEVNANTVVRTYDYLQGQEIIHNKRSIIFMSVDGEEAGLTGSTYYTNHPLVPQNKVAAILNLEQVGVGEMLGANYHYKYPELAELSEKANDRYVHRRLFTSETHFLTRPRTDGAVFMKAGYPCIDLWALGGGYYHHPKDNTQSINPDILRAATEWLYWTTIFIADK